MPISKHRRKPKKAAPVRSLDVVIAHDKDGPSDLFWSIQIASHGAGDEVEDISPATRASLFAYMTNQPDWTVTQHEFDNWLQALVDAEVVEVKGDLIVPAPRLLASLSTAAAISHANRRLRGLMAAVMGDFEQAQNDGRVQTY